MIVQKLWNQLEGALVFYYLISFPNGKDEDEKKKIIYNRIILGGRFRNSSSIENTDAQM